MGRTDKIIVSPVKREGKAYGFTSIEAARVEEPGFSELRVTLHRGEKMVGDLFVTIDPTSGEFKVLLSAGGDASDHVREYYIERAPELAFCNEAGAAVVKTSVARPPERTVTLNESQALYVIPCGEGCTTWGFQNCWDELTQLAELLKKAPPARELFGTLEAYELSRVYMRQYALTPLSRNTWYSKSTPPELVAILETARVSGQMFRIFCGDVKTGRSWLEEHDVIGTIGRTTGPKRSLILVPRGADSGGIILTDCIVRIMRVSDRTDIYRHPLFHIPDLVVRPSPDLENNGGLGAAVVDRADGLVHAQFETVEIAEGWLKFIRGDATAWKKK